MKNLFIFTFQWIVGSFAYFIIIFQMKYINGDFYVNLVVTSISEMCAYYLTGVIYQKLGIKTTYFVSHFIGVAGCLLYVVLSPLYPHLVPFLLLGSAFGFCSACMVNWLANEQLFPVIYASSTNGICSFFSRISAFLSPQIAEIDQPFPMIVVVMAGTFAAILSSFLNVNRE